MSIETNDVDARLLWLLKRAGEEWGPAGVAKVAARLVQPSTPPLYVNHDRAEPVAGDVVRSEPGTLVSFYVGSYDTNDYCWIDQDGEKWVRPPNSLRLLVDGSTGQVVR